MLTTLLASLLSFLSSVLSVSPCLVSQDPPFDVIRYRDGQESNFRMVFPDTYKPGNPYPVLLYLPDAPQTQAQVNTTLDRLAPEASARRWIMIGVCAPKNGRLSQLTGDQFNELLTLLDNTFAAQDAKYYALGEGTGATASLLFAPVIKPRLKSLVCLRGGAEDYFMGTMNSVNDLPITFIVGDQDKPALIAVNQTLVTIQGAGSLKTQEVIIPSGDAKFELSPPQIFEALTATATGKAASIAMQSAKTTPIMNDEQLITATLDSLHDAAAKADEPRYFNLYAPNAVFLGTDAKERWTLEEFKAFAHPYFAKGKAWTYTLVKDTRFITIEGATKDVACFDETLQNAKLGTCRGSGILVKLNGDWKIKQYNLTMLIPNEVAEQAAALSKPK